jgi:hypothetical protein
MKTSGSFHAMQDPASSKITIVRSPAHDEIDDTFSFNSSAEMRTTLISTYEQAGVDSILQDLANTGSADFLIQNDSPQRLVPLVAHAVLRRKRQ